MRPRRCARALYNPHFPKRPAPPGSAPTSVQEPCPFPVSILLILALTTAAALLLGLFAEALAILRARVPPQVRTLRLGPTDCVAAASQPIPRVIWTYWDALPAPALISQCLRLWQHVAPDHEVRLVDRSTASRWLDTDIESIAFDALQAYRQADWLRLQLLKRHGGIWIDGSTLLTESLDWVHRLHAERGAGVVGFYIDRYTTDRRCPIVENWFLAAPSNDPFIAAWSDELDRALALGESGYLEALRREGRLDAVAQGIPEDMRAYLVMHLAASTVLQRTPTAYPMRLQRAEDVAFAFHAALRWRKRHLYARLALTPAPRRVPALIKLRSGDRAVMEKLLARGWIWRRSLLARLLEMAG
jgi:hypothetical protein